MFIGNQGWLLKTERVLQIGHVIGTGHFIRDSYNTHLSLHVCCVYYCMVHVQYILVLVWFPFLLAFYLVLQFDFFLLYF